VSQASRPRAATGARSRAFTSAATDICPRKRPGGVPSLRPRAGALRVRRQDPRPADNVFFAALWNLCGRIGVGENDLDVTDTGTCR
jgi:hypothetical protein